MGTLLVEIFFDQRRGQPWKQDFAAFSGIREQERPPFSGVNAVTTSCPTAVSTTDTKHRGSPREPEPMRGCVAVDVPPLCTLLTAYKAAPPGQRHRQARG